MARQLQAAEPMQNITVRMPVPMVAAIDAYRARLKAQYAAFTIERGEAVRDLLLKALALVEAHGPDDAGGGPGEAPVTRGEAQSADHSPMGKDQSLPTSGARQDQHRTTGRKRMKAVQEG